LIETHFVSWYLTVSGPPGQRYPSGAPDTTSSPPAAVWDHPVVPLDRESLFEIADRVPTAPIAAAGLIGGFAVAVTTGSRPLGGALMAVLGVGCIAVWLHRDGRSVATKLTVAGLLAFAISHVLGLVIGAWPSVIVVSAVTAALCWRLSDSRRAGTSVAAGASVG
jgi:hypothetical protein